MKNKIKWTDMWKQINKQINDKYKVPKKYKKEKIMIN